MKMKQSQFEAIANVIRGLLEIDGRETRKCELTHQLITERFADALSATNPLFDRKRFMEACGQ